MATVSRKFFGVVEGFYWDQENQYPDGQYGEYSHDQRRKLLRFMGAKGLNVYVYDPKVVIQGARKDRAITLLDGEALTQWKETFKLAKELKIEFIWGLTPYDTRQRLKNVIRQITGSDVGAAGVALLFDDTGTENEILQQGKLVKELWEEFKDKIKAYCPPCYKGEPVEIQRQLEQVHQEEIPKCIPFVFTGRSNCSRHFTSYDFPTFKDRKIVVWDNWIAHDKLLFSLLLPPNRQNQLQDHMSGYWLNLPFPVEIAIPVVSAITFLQHGKLPLNSETEKRLLVGDGGIADEWAQEMGCFSHFTRAVLKVKLKNREALINPLIDFIVKFSDILTLRLLLDNHFDINAPIMTGATFLHLALDHKNYPLARYLDAQGARIDQTIDWDALQQEWENSFIENLKGCSDLQTLEVYLWSQENNNRISIPLKMGKTLMEIAFELKNYPLAKYLQQKGATIDESKLEDLRREWKSNFRRPDLHFPSKYRYLVLSNQLVESIKLGDLVKFRRLLQMGVNVSDGSSEGTTPVQMAECINNKPLIEYLKALEDFKK